MDVTPKKVKILYKTLIKYEWSKGDTIEDRSSPFWEVLEVVKFIKKKSKKNKIRDLKGDKFCFLENFHIVDEPNKDRTEIYGFIKSARNKFRPNIVNRQTGEERPNPRLLVEGDIEKTHFAIVLDRKLNEVYFIHQYNFYGITIKEVLAYLKFFAMQYAEKKKLKKTFTLKHLIIPEVGFIEALQAMSRVKVADVYIDKQLLGSDALNMSNRLVNVKSEMKLTIGSTPRNSIKSTAVDIFNSFTAGDKSISKIRIEGKDSRDNDILIDTSFMNRQEFITVDKENETGELVSSQVISELKLLTIDI
jgi:hypothetical protein